MSLLDGVRRQLRSVIEWRDDGVELFSLWSDNGDEIKNASKLIIGPGQGCIFVYEGRVKAMFHEEGMYQLDSDNVPFWTTLKKFMQFFESEHKTAFYFFRKTLVLDQKWGTSSPVRYQDPVYDIPVGLKAYGNFTYRLANPDKFYREIIGQRERLTLADLRDVLAPRLLHSLADYLAEQAFSYAQIDAERDEIAKAVLLIVNEEFSALGLGLIDLRIEGTDFDEETRQRIGRIADVTADSMAARKAGIDYAELQRLEALKAAAQNESGAAGVGVGIGAGIGLGQAMAQPLATSAEKPAGDSDAPDIVGAMLKLKQLHELGAISEAEYTDKKQELLARL